MRIYLKIVCTYIHSETLDVHQRYQYVCHAAIYLYSAAVSLFVCSLFNGTSVLLGY